MSLRHEAFSSPSKAGKAVHDQPSGDKLEIYDGNDDVPASVRAVYFSYLKEIRRQSTRDANEVGTASQPLPQCVDDNTADLDLRSKQTTSAQHQRQQPAQQKADGEASARKRKHHAAKPNIMRQANANTERRGQVPQERGTNCKKDGIVARQAHVVNMRERWGGREDEETAVVEEEQHGEERRKYRHIVASQPATEEDDETKQGAEGEEGRQAPRQVRTGIRRRPTGHRRYEVGIFADGQQVHVGSFYTMEEAVCARERAEREKALGLQITQIRVTTPAKARAQVNQNGEEDNWEEEQEEVKIKEPPDMDQYLPDPTAQALAQGCQATPGKRQQQTAAKCAPNRSATRLWGERRTQGGEEVVPPRVPGVSWQKRTGRWRVRLRHNGKQVYIGSYRAHEEAAQAMHRAEREVALGLPITQTQVRKLAKDTALVDQSEEEDNGEEDQEQELEEEEVKITTPPDVDQCLLDIEAQAQGCQATASRRQQQPAAKCATNTHRTRLPGVSRAEGGAAAVSPRVRGVSWHAQTRKWRVRLRNNGQQVHIGIYCTHEEAARAMSRAKKEVALGLPFTETQVRGLAEDTAQVDQSEEEYNGEEDQEEEIKITTPPHTDQCLVNMKAQAKAQGCQATAGKSQQKQPATKCASTVNTTTLLGGRRTEGGEEAVSPRVRGVSWHTKERKWRVQLPRKNAKQLYIGSYHVHEEAVHAMHRAEREFALGLPITLDRCKATAGVHLKTRVHMGEEEEEEEEEQEEDVVVKEEKHQAFGRCGAGFLKTVDTQQNEGATDLIPHVMPATSGDLAWEVRLGDELVGRYAAANDAADAAIQLAQRANKRGQADHRLL